VFFVNDSVGYCCGESMTLLKTQNKGNNWQEINLKNTYSYDDFYNGSLHGIIGNEKNLIIVGGKNFNVGIIVRIANNSVVEGYKGFDNEFRCGFNFNNYIACGYGTPYKTEDDGKTYNPTNFKGDFLTSCITLNSTTGFACGYDGNVYKTSNAGDSYTKIFDHNRFYKKHLNFNGINFINDTKGCVVGNKGYAYQTNNGKKFDKINLNTSADLYSITLNKNNEAVVSTSDGKLIVFSY
jgi:photosystem II stability/assembly factor-like uncharacterized protein